MASTGFDSQIDAYAAFGSALEAAGAAGLAGAGEEAVREQLRRAALADRDAFERALEPVAEAEREHYGAGSPEAALLLPVRGLRAVADRV